MDQKILNIFKQHQLGYTVNELTQLLNLTSKKSQQELVNTLQALVNDYQLIKNKRQKYFLASQYGYLTGVAEIKAAGYGFVDFSTSKSLYLPKQQVKNIMSGDTVVVKKHPHLDEAILIKIIKRRLTELIGKIEFQKKRWRFSSEHEINGINLKVSNPHHFKLTPNATVIVQIDVYGKRLEGHISKVLTVDEAEYRDILAVLIDHGLSYEFDPAVKAEAEALPQQVNVKLESARQDLSQLLTVSIDGAEAKDLDDAFSLREIPTGYELIVHIADVSHYVKVGSQIDQAALARGNSIYPLNLVVPMLPEQLSNGICSLLPNQPRLALSCQMEFDYNGELLNYAFFPSLIINQARLTYQEVEDYLTNAKNSTRITIEVTKLLETAAELSALIRKKRQQQGALDFISSETAFVYNQQTLVEIKTKKRLNSEQIIEDFMIIANNCAAHYLLSQQPAGIFRIHDQPDQSKIQTTLQLIKTIEPSLKLPSKQPLAKQLQALLKHFAANPLAEVISGLLLRSLPKAYYAETNKGHFGLALAEYTHFTAPIRRYADLSVHRLIKAYLAQTTPPADLALIAEQASKQERLALSVEREVEALKKAEYLANKIGERFTGIIVSFTSFGFFVRLTNSIEGLVHFDRLNEDFYQLDELGISATGLNHHQRYHLGQSVLVEVFSASKLHRQIDFVLVE